MKIYITIMLIISILSMIDKYRLLSKIHTHNEHKKIAVLFWATLYIVAIAFLYNI